MIIKAIIIAVVIFFSVVVLAITFAGHIIRFLLRKLVEMMSPKRMDTDNYTHHDYTGRRSQQYGFRGHSSSGHHTKSKDGVYVSDPNGKKSSGKQIFSDDEGEYVDFEEV